MEGKKRQYEFLREHSLGIVSILFLVGWLIAYGYADPDSHAGAFFGNAIADWSGSVVIIYGTKYLLEANSPESKKVRRHRRSRLLDFFHRHSLLIFLFTTGLGWALLFWKMSVNSKWGQVVGNIVSEWVQMGGLVFLTKRLVEKGSRESK